MISLYSKRDLRLVILILFFGAILGTLFGDLIAFVLPEGVVKQFFLQSTEFSLGGIFGGDDEALSLNLGAITFIIGLKVKLNFATIFGIGVSYYFLRYFR